MVDEGDRMGKYCCGKNENKAFLEQINQTGLSGGMLSPSPPDAVFHRFYRVLVSYPGRN